jgi:hypothetical protein
MALDRCLKIGELTSRVFEQSPIGTGRTFVNPCADQVKKSLDPAIKKPFDLFFSSLQCDLIAKKLREGNGQGKAALNFPEVRFSTPDISLLVGPFLCSKAVIVLANVRSSNRTPSRGEKRVTNQTNQ